MHAETFLREFAPLASGPGGVQKLRDLVLQLAVRGRLVSQDSDDEPAAHFLSKLNAKARVKVGEGIPQGWAETQLGTFGTFVGGLTPSKARSEFWGEGMPWVSPKDMGSSYIFDAQDHVTSLALEKTTLTRVPSGSLLLVVRSGILRRKLPVAITKVDCVTNQDMKALVFSDNRFGEFLRLLLKGWQSRILSDLVKTGTTVQSLRFNDFQKATWPIPPLAEQKRIVAKVDELMALCDALDAQQAEETGLKRAAAASALHHLTETETPEEIAERWSTLAPRFGELFDDLETIKALRGAISDLAVNGSLGTSVPGENASSETEALRKHREGLSERKEIPRKLASLGPPTAGERLHVKSSNWDQVRIGELALALNYGTSEKATANSSTGVLVYGMGQIKEGQLVETGAKYLDKNSDCLPDLFLKNGDILFNRTNSYALVGKAALYEGEDECRTFASYLIRILPDREFVDASFILLYLNSPLCRETQIEPEITRQTNQANFNGSKLANIVMPFPPLSEQKRIVAKVGELLAMCDRLEEQVRDGERLNSELMASLVRGLASTDPDGGGAAETVGLSKYPPEVSAPELASGDALGTPEIKGLLPPQAPEAEVQLASDRVSNVDTKFQEAVLVAAIVRTFFQNGGEPIGNFRLQKAVYFARRQMGENVGEMAYLRKAAGPYNPSMKYSGGIAIAKRKSWLREARGRFGFGHVPGAEVAEASEWIETYGYGEPARWVADRFRYKKNDEWETLATVDYAVEHLRSLDIDPDAEQILQYIASDPEWHPKIEKLRLTEISVGTAMLAVTALFNPKGEDEPV